MKISEIEIGMKYRISNNLKKTNKIWSINKSMIKMRGKIYKVVHIRQKYTTMENTTIEYGLDLQYGKTIHDTWVFCPEDVKPIRMTPSIDSVIFDPHNLEIPEQNNK